MHTISEIAVTSAIWALTAIGCFFGIRAAIRKRRARCNSKVEVSSKME